MVQILIITGFPLHWSIYQRDWGTKQHFQLRGLFCWTSVNQLGHLFCKWTGKGELRLWISYDMVMMTLNGKISDTYLWKNRLGYVVIDYIQYNFGYFKVEDLLTHENTKKAVFIKKVQVRKQKQPALQVFSFCLRFNTIKTVKYIC